MLGYLLVRGGVHAMAYGKSLEALTGVEVWKMLPLPRVENAKFPEAAKYERWAYTGLCIVSATPTIETSS